MYLTNVACLVAFALCVQSKYIPVRVFINDVEDQANVIPDIQEDILLEVPPERYGPLFKSIRTRRQAVGALQPNSNKNQDVDRSPPVTDNGQRLPSVNSAYSSTTGFTGNQFDAPAAGLAFNNANRHAFSVMGPHIPPFGNQMTAAAHAALLQNEMQNVASRSNAFFTRNNMLNQPNVPDFNDFGRSVYIFGDNGGSPLDIIDDDEDLLRNLNPLRNQNPAFNNFNTGFTRSQSTTFENSDWEPSGRLIITRNF